MEPNDIALDTSRLDSAYSQQLEDEAISTMLASPFIKSEYSIAQVVTASLSKRSNLLTRVCTKGTIPNCSAYTSIWDTSECFWI